MSRAVSPLLWLTPALALAIPPFLLVPFVLRLPAVQLFKVLYEACLWISPAIGLCVLTLIGRGKRAGVLTLRQPALLAALLLAGADLLSPILFYLLLALLAGR